MAVGGAEGGVVGQAGSMGGWVAQELRAALLKVPHSIEYILISVEIPGTLRPSHITCV